MDTPADPHPKPPQADSPHGPLRRHKGPMKWTVTQSPHVTDGEAGAAQGSGEPMRGHAESPQRKAGTVSPLTRPACAHRTCSVDAPVCPGSQEPCALEASCRSISRRAVTQHPHPALPTRQSIKGSFEPGCPAHPQSPGSAWTRRGFHGFRLKAQPATRYCVIDASSPGCQKPKTA